MNKGSTQPQNGLWVLHLFCCTSPHGAESDPPLKRLEIQSACSEFLHSKIQGDIASDLVGDIEGDIEGDVASEEVSEGTQQNKETQQKHSHKNQLVAISLLGHKADIAFMALSPDAWPLRHFQSQISNSGLEIVDSYLSLTEVSEYASGLPEEMKQDRLYPTLPPEEKPIWGFYPMSKRRGESQNWFTLDYEKRKELMHEHGSSGRKFSGRITQLITGSTGIDNYEWGVTLFCDRPDSLKEVVYTMRFDEASAKYAEFGPFYTGMVGTLDQVLDSLEFQPPL